jgi:prephenate dehydratase
LLGADVPLLFCDSFPEAFAALDKGRANRAVLPIENTTAGIIQPVWDRLLGISPGASLSARAEARVRIGFVAAALPGSATKVRKILSHPVAEAQCRQFLSDSGWTVVACHDTAGAARMVREANDPTLAALCPLPAARLYGLEVLHPECGDSLRTWTRFLLLEFGKPTPQPSDDRAIFIFSLRDVAGALVQTLASFSQQGLNLAAIHSRAVPGSPGEYRFFVELNAGAKDPRCLAAVVEIENGGADMHLLGSYQTPPWPATVPER